MRAVVLVFLTLLSASQLTLAQGISTALQVGVPIERTLSGNQSHSYTIELDQDQLVDLVVDQRGIDVIVRVFKPSGRLLKEFDTPNGDQGPENVEFIATTSGVYRIEVAPLTPQQNSLTGKYEIKLTDLRKATAEELAAASNEEVRKAKALALLTETIQTFDQLRRPQTRARIEIRAARLLWNSDEKRAMNLMTEAMDSIKEFIGDIDNSEEEYYQSYEEAWQLRQQLVTALAPHDPDAALNFLRATRILRSPYQQSGQTDQEMQLELQVVNRTIDSDPKRAFALAEDSLKRGSSTSLIETLMRLQSKDADLAAKLAHDIASKLGDQQLLKTPEAAYLAGSFLHVVRSRAPARSNDGSATSPGHLLPEDEYRELFLKALSEVLSYSPPSMNAYTPEREVAQNLANTLKQLTSDLRTYAPDRAEALEKKSVELSSGRDPQNALWQSYQDTINKESVETALATLPQAPPQVRDQLYQQLAMKVAAGGDLARAKQLLTDNLTNPMQRRQAMRILEQQAIFAAAAKQNFDEALRLLSTFRPLSERNSILGQVLEQMAGGMKKATAVAYLEQAKAMLGSSPRVENPAQMYALLAIARVFARYGINRSSEIIEPLIDQFNDMSVAAATLDGFGQNYYRDGELISNNGNTLEEIANQLSTTLGALSTTDFDRAKNSAARLRLVDVRLRVLLAMVEHNLPAKDQNEAN